MAAPGEFADIIGSAAVRLLVRDCLLVVYPKAVPEPSATGGTTGVPALLLVLPLLETELPLMLGCAAQAVRAGGKAKGGGVKSAVDAAGVDRQARPFQKNPRLLKT